MADDPFVPLNAERQLDHSSWEIMGAQPDNAAGFHFDRRGAGDDHPSLGRT
jgi:hypothetical protein